MICNSPYNLQDKNVLALFLDDNLSAKFLETSLCVVNANDAAAANSAGDAPSPPEEVDNDSLPPPTNWKVKLELEAAFRVVFALHGGDAEVQELLSPGGECCKSKCNIL